MNIPEISHMQDPQTRNERRCPVCDGCVYPPSFYCIRCERRAHDASRIKPKL